MYISSHFPTDENNQTKQTFHPPKSPNLGMQEKHKMQAKQQKTKQTLTNDVHNTTTADNSDTHYTVNEPNF